MAALATTAVTLTGTLYPATAVSSSDTFTPGNDVYLQVTNGGGSPDTVAISTPATSRGLAIAEAGGSVAAATTRHFGPFPADLFADPTTGLVTVTHSFTTSVTCAVFKLTPL